jgi:hypothetical protein
MEHHPTQQKMVVMENPLLVEVVEELQAEAMH